ncbi:MAG TPA: FAD-dependent oxidoreductase, partial [Anaeromyxobacteraceae bacterium]|nr:FAD-dependent oxidoreductase [Anaeromyxobacteraceae bacterium]
MPSTRYLIVGGGMTGHAAAAAIREADPGGTLAMISGERHPPYARPPLSKGLWAGKPRESVFLPEVEGLVRHPGRRAVALVHREHALRDDRGEEHRYERLLLATGGRPRRLAVGGDRVVYFRTLDDYDRLRASGRSAVVIGGGFIGTEIAAALATAGKEVTMVFPESAIGARSYPADLARFVTSYYERRGVR